MESAQKQRKREKKHGAYILLRINVYTEKGNKTIKETSRLLKM